MKIFYTASYPGKVKYQKEYDLVLRALENTHAEITSPEKGNYRKFEESHYQAIRRGILAADAVVIEISQEDFQLGHEATLAIQAKKHVLCLSTHEDFSQKIDNRYFHGGKYNKMNIEELIENFIKLANKELLSRRFNLFLSESQFGFLDQVSKKQGTTVSEYVRTLIDKSRELS